MTIKSGAEGVRGSRDALCTLGHSGRHVLEPQAKPAAAESLAQFWLLKCLDSKSRLCSLLFDQFLAGFSQGLDFSFSLL